MASVSGTSSSLGNTSLRGYGGMASGIDRDSIIEQMTLGTTTKIANQKKSITKLQWKQEAYQSISGKILDLQDNYLSFSSSTNLKSTSLFSKNQISVLGDSDVTKYITASGSSSLSDYVSIKGVSNLATSATQTSKAKGTRDIQTGIAWNDTVKTSNLQGKKITFAQYTTKNGFTNAVSFSFPSSYTEDYEENGVTKTRTIDIDYTTDDTDTLVKQLNKALEQSSVTFGSVKIGDAIKFENQNGKIQIGVNKQDKYDNVFGENGYVIEDSSSALEALGYKKGTTDDGSEADTSKGIKIADFNNSIASNLKDSAVKEQSAMSYIAGKKFSVTYGGQKKEITLVDEADFADKKDADGNVNWDNVSADDVTKAIQKRLNSAFGKDKVTVSIETDGTMKFTPTDSSQTLSVSSTDSAVQKALGLVSGASNKLSTSASLKDNWEKLGFTATDDKNSVLKDFSINGVSIDVDEDTTIDDLLDKINSNKEIGVKATYLASENKFVLISTETGTGRDIELGGAADTIFGGEKEVQADGTVIDKGAKAGTDATMLVDYGGGMTSTVTSSSNTFNLDGMNVTVSGTFNVDGSDSSQTVTFSAKADVDGITEKIKKFIDDYNALVSEIKTQVTTKPDSSYGPLTDDQKSEMSETSIENWEKKAKEGLLYNNSTLRDLNSDLQSVLVSLMSSGANPNDLEKIGITISDDYSDGGKLVFDEATFKEAVSTDPDTVSNIISGGGDVKKGLVEVIENTLTPYATRYASKNGNSYGRLIEEAGSPKVPLSVSNNEIYKQLKDMNEQLENLKTKLSTEQDRYISQFSTMETLISQMNSQASWLSGQSS